MMIIIILYINHYYYSLEKGWQPPAVQSLLSHLQLGPSHHQSPRSRPSETHWELFNIGEGRQTAQGSMRLEKRTEKKTGWKTDTQGPKRPSKQPDSPDTLSLWSKQEFPSQCDIMWLQSALLSLCVSKFNQSSTETVPSISINFHLWDRHIDLLIKTCGKPQWVQSFLNVSAATWSTHTPQSDSAHQKRSRMPPVSFTR